MCLGFQAGQTPLAFLPGSPCRLITPFSLFQLRRQVFKSPLGPAILGAHSPLPHQSQSWGTPSKRSCCGLGLQRAGRCLPIGAALLPLPKWLFGPVCISVSILEPGRADLIQTKRRAGSFLGRRLRCEAAVARCCSMRGRPTF